MCEAELNAKREAAVHLLRSGVAAKKVAQELGCSISWVYKCKALYAAGKWEGLRCRSRAPQRVPRQLPESVRQSILKARSELEAGVERENSLRYVGSGAVLAKLKGKVKPLPSKATIERVLRKANMTRSYCRPEKKEVAYPHVHPTKPGQLCQVDIVPHFLRGGQAIACFNAIDPVSRNPTGQAYEQRGSKEAVKFLIHVWQELGVPQHTQVDNEGCFSGGFTHPGVLGKVLRLALYVGTELIFSPLRHPESNGSVERFHQDYNQHVWEDTDLLDCSDVQSHAQTFFADYRRSNHHSDLGGYSPAEVHARSLIRRLPPTFTLPKKLPLTAGRVHFMRQVSHEKTVSLLNLTWAVPLAEPGQGVWVTIEFCPGKATLRVYEQPPDALERRCLAKHPFPINEEVQPLRAEFQTQPTTSVLVEVLARAFFRLAQARAFVSTMF